MRGTAIPVPRRQTFASRLLQTPGAALRAWQQSLNGNYAGGGLQPPITVTPFTPGGQSTGAGIVKLTTALYAAARNRSNANILAKRQALQDQLTQAHIDEASSLATERANKAANPTKTYSLTVPGLPQNLPNAMAGPPAVGEPETVSGLTPSEYLAARGKYNPETVPLTTVQSQNADLAKQRLALSTARAADAHARTAYYLSRGAHGAELKFPALDRSAITQAQQGVGHALSDYDKRYWAPGGLGQTGAAYDVDSDPAVAAAKSNHVATIKRAYIGNMQQLGTQDPSLMSRTILEKIGEEPSLGKDADFLGAARQMLQSAQVPAATQDMIDLRHIIEANLPSTPAPAVAPVTAPVTGGISQ